MGHRYRATVSALLFGGVNALVSCSPPCPAQHLLMLEHARLDSVSAEHLRAYHTLMSVESDRLVAQGVSPPDSASPRQQALVALYRVITEANTGNLRHERIELGHITQQADCATLTRDYAQMRADHARWRLTFDSVQTLLARYPTSRPVQ